MGAFDCAFPSQAISDSRSRTAPDATIKFPSNAYYGLVFAFNDMKYTLHAGDKAELTTSIVKPHIFLPLPTSGMIESLNINYRADEMGAAVQLLGAGSAAADAWDEDRLAKVTGGRSKTADERTNALAQTVAAGGMATRVALGALAPQVGAAVDMKLGNIINPFNLSLFQGVTPRAHNFTFMLVPRSAPESETIRKIINEFRLAALPNLKAQGTLLTLPQEVTIAFFGTPNLYKFAPCVITSVTVNYSPFGIPSFFGEDQSPTAIELTLTFQEVEALNRHSYDSSAPDRNS